jgi:predicted ATPase
MAITDFKIEGYRSIKELWLKLQPINVIVGPNGSGKSNLYRAMYLLSCAANGQFARALAEEGGILSALWAGGWAKSDDNKHCLTLSVRTKNFEYTMVCGTAGDVVKPRFFSADPEIKSETIYLLEKGQKKKLLERRRVSVYARNTQGKDVEYTARVGENESVLAGLRDPVNFPHLFAIREEILGWRFYHHFRTDLDSPLRTPQIGVMTPVLSHDGSDLAAALATIIECGDVDALFEAIDEAFPGAGLSVEPSSAGLRICFMQEGLVRPFEGTELSDGTLQYLCLLAALLSMSAPPVIVLNEPETSLHPDLIKPLANLIVRCSNDTQIWITTHSRELADTIMDLTGYDPIELKKDNGRTKLVGRGLGGYRENDREDDKDDDRDEENK